MRDGLCGSPVQKDAASGVAKGGRTIVTLQSMPLIPMIIWKVRRVARGSSSVANFCASIIACRNLSSSRASGRDTGAQGGSSHPILTNVLQWATLWCMSLSKNRTSQHRTRDTRIVEWVVVSNESLTLYIVPVASQTSFAPAAPPNSPHPPIPTPSIPSRTAYASAYPSTPPTCSPYTPKHP